MEIEQQRTELLMEWDKHRPHSDLKVSSFSGKPLVIKDESSQRTGTYKDWHGWMLGKHYLQNHFPNPFSFSSIISCSVSSVILDINKILFFV